MEFAPIDYNRLMDFGTVPVAPVSATETATLVHLKGPEVDSYGDMGYGEHEVFMVFRVGNEHYRIDGTASSYGGYSWDGKPRPVTPVTKTIEVWE